MASRAARSGVRASWECGFGLARPWIDVSLGQTDGAECSPTLLVLRGRPPMQVPIESYPRPNYLSYVPEGGRPHKVGNETWESIAADHQLDVQDLIAFNFKT